MKAPDSERSALDDNELLAAVFHDLRDPIAAVLMHSGALRKLDLPGEGGDRVRKRADAINRSADRALKLLADVHDVLRFRQERLSLQPTETSLDELMKQVEASASEVLQARSATLRLSAPAVKATCDASKLSRALHYLVVRALLASPAHSVATLSMNPVDGRIDGSVRVEGAEENEAHPSRAESLGWAISETFLQAHGGSVEKVGVGAKFSWVSP